VQHQERIVAVACSPDGKLVVTAGDGARLWEVATGKLIGLPLQHQCKAVAFSPDGKTVLTGSGDGTARLWETATGKPIGPPLQHQGLVVGLALSADGKTALTGSRDKTARLWKVPQPIRGEPERIMLWARLMTGLEVDDLTAVRVLDATAWHERRARLEKFGGPPAQ